MTGHPTLAQLRAKVQKDRHREIGNWPARRWARPTAVYGTWLAIRLGLSAHQVTLVALATALASAWAVGQGTRGGFILGAVLGWLAFWLDHVDGQVARWRGAASLDGVYLDYMMHHVQTLALAFGLGYGLAAREDDPRWSAAGFLVALGWSMLNVQNDCRYKAVFQRLKREARTFRVDGGGGGRPEPAAPWPVLGFGRLTWPAYKACEGHVVLAAVSLLALLGALWPVVWLIWWKAYVLGMAVGAPLLMVGRVARAVRREAVSREFDDWFVEAPRSAGP